MIPPYRLLAWTVSIVGCASAALGSYYTFSPAKNAFQLSGLTIPHPPKDTSARGQELAAAEKDLAEVKRNRTEVNARLGELDNQKKAAAARVAKANQEKIDSTRDPAMTAMQRKVSTIKDAPPTWADLGLKDLDPLKTAWSDAGDSTKRNKALDLIATELQHLEAERSTHVSSAADTVSHRLTLVIALERKPSEIENEILGHWNVAALGTEKEQLLKAIGELLTQTQRAKVQHDFTNSVGMEMAWIAIESKPGYPGGGFWIGKREVTHAALKKIVPQLAQNCSADPEGLAYRVVWSEADKFCKALTESENQASAPDQGQLAPKGWHYELPNSGVWKHVATNAADYGAVNFGGGVNELLADPARSGYRAIFERANDSRPKMIPDSRDFTQVGAATDGAKAGTIKLYEGQVGFRVILVLKE